MTSQENAKQHGARLADSITGRMLTFSLELRMGKGDQRTKRGKIYRGCYGKARPKRPKKNTAAKSQ